MQKILVVEDEQMLAKIIGMKLEEEKFTVEHAYDGQEAYDRLSKTDDVPDLVLLDVLLPKMSGFDVMEKLKSEKKAIPKIIVFSNFAQKADVERAKTLGAVDYIVKAAFSPAEILSKIKAILNDGSKSAGSNENAFKSFDSLEDVMPMSEVLNPDDSTDQAKADTDKAA